MALTCCKLTVAARHESQFRLLTEKGIQTVDGTNLPCRKMDTAIDTTGFPEGFKVALNVLCPRGTLVGKSTYAGKIQIDFSSGVVDEITIIGSRCGPFKPALDLLARKKNDPTALISARYPLSNGLEAL